MTTHATNNNHVRRLGVLFVGAAAAATTMAIGAPAPAKAVNGCVSIGSLKLHTGSASCGSTGVLGMAIALGPNSLASTAGFGSFAFALGADTQAVAGTTTNDDFNTALAFGKGSIAQAFSGVLNYASAWGGGLAVASVGDFNLATARGTGSEARAGQGGVNFAGAYGPGNEVTAGGAQQSGSWNMATAWGENNVVQAVDGYFNRSTARGKANVVIGGAGDQNSALVSGEGNFVMSAMGDGTTAYVRGTGNVVTAIAGNGGRAYVFGQGNKVGLGGGEDNGAYVRGDNNEVTVGDPTNQTPSNHNWASVTGKKNTVTAGPGNNHRISVRSDNATAHNP